MGCFFLFHCFFNKCALHYFFRNTFKRKIDCVIAFPSSIIVLKNSLLYHFHPLLCRFGFYSQLCSSVESYSDPSGMVSKGQPYLRSV